MTRATRSTRQPSRSPDRLDELINLRRYPVDPVEYQNLLQQHQALLAAIDAVPTPASPNDGLLRHPMFQGLGPMLPDVPGDLFALDREASATPEAASGRRASRRSRSRSATPASRGRFAVGSTPTLPAQSPRVGDLANRGFSDLPANFFDSSPPRARAVSAVVGGEGSPSYTPTSPAYNPVSPEDDPYSAWAVSSPRLPSPSYNPTSPAYRPGPVLGPYGASSASPFRSPVGGDVASRESSPAYRRISPAYNPVQSSPLFANAARSPVGGTVARRLDEIDATLERLQRRVDLRADRIDAQLLAITQTLSGQREGAAASNNERKRKQSSDNRDVVDLTGRTPSPKSPKKVDFVDLVSESSSSGSSSSSSDSSSSSSDSTDDDDNDDDKPSTPSKKPKYSSDSPFASPRSPKTPPNNRTPSPPKTPRKAPPKRPAPRTPPRQRAPSVPSTPPAPRKTRAAAAASRSPAAQAPRTPPQQTAPATPAAPRTTPAAPRKNRSRTREATTSPTPAAAPGPAPAPAPAPARQPTRASSRIRERAAGTAYRPLLKKSITGRGPRSCPRPGHK